MSTKATMTTLLRSQARARGCRGVHGEGEVAAAAAAANGQLALFSTQRGGYVLISEWKGASCWYPDMHPLCHKRGP
jgi:hypothetical protein